MLVEHCEHGTFISTEMMLKPQPVINQRTGQPTTTCHCGLSQPLLSLCPLASSAAFLYLTSLNSHFSKYYTRIGLFLTCLISDLTACVSRCVGLCKSNTVCYQCHRSPRSTVNLMNIMLSLSILMILRSNKILNC